MVYLFYDWNSDPHCYQVSIYLLLCFIQFPVSWVVLLKGTFVEIHYNGSSIKAFFVWFSGGQWMTQDDSALEISPGKFSLSKRAGT